MSPLDFSMTPRLQEILERDEGSQLHPSMPSNTHMDDGLVIYNPEMELPDKDDKLGILAWLGINETVSEKAIQDYEDHRAAFVLDNRLDADDTPENMVHNLCRVFLFEIPKEWHLDGAEGFEGYVNLAFRIGLKPEFALLCGIHPDNTWMPADERGRWYIQTLVQHVKNLVGTYAAMLVALWRERDEYNTKKAVETTEI